MMLYPSNECTQQQAAGRIRPKSITRFLEKFSNLIRCSVVAVFGYIAAPAACALEFLPEVSYELSSTSPTDVVVSDLNGDSFPDMAVAMSASGGGDGTISFLLSNGAGGFSGSNLADGIFNAWGVAAADLNGDLLVDLAVTIYVTNTGANSREVRILRGDGAGGFSTLSSSYSPADAPRSVAHGDFNEDTVPDLLVGMDTGVAIHLGIPSQVQTPTGSFADGVMISGSGSLSGQQVVVGYINSDTHLDAATPQAVYLGAGDGTFTRSAFFATFKAVALGYLNNDNIIDLVLVTGTTLQVQYGNGDGTFQFGYNQAMGADLSDVAIADLNQDLIDDIVVASKGNDSVIVQLGAYDNPLPTPQSFAVGIEPTQVVIADWNQDGFQDIAASYANQAQTPGMSILIQQPVAVDTDGDGIPDASDNCILVPNTDQRDTDADGYGSMCDPDFNNDLMVNVIDFAYMRNQFFSNDPLADLNGDGFVAASDLAVLKALYFKPPGPSGIAP